jgi:hypothetical protein
MIWRQPPDPPIAPASNGWHQFAMAALPALVVALIMFTIQAGKTDSTKIVEQLAENNEKLTKLTEKVTMLCERMVAKDERDEEHDNRIDTLDKQVIRINQKIGLN